uniref:VWFA domain-containing protein n=1 Tax=viral metagenome TaxID=1070528 RepID=A0A6C0B7B2_9ZZZZ
MSCVDSAYFEFHSENCPIDVVNPDEQFGVLRLITSSVKITSQPTFLLFSIDNTGSMSELTDGFVSKMDIVKASFKSIILYLSGLDAPIYISVHTFNEIIDVIVDKVHITKDNVNDIISKISDISPDRSTDIELALNNAKTVIEEYKALNQEHKIAHIFMTDGHATKGSVDKEILTKLVKNTDCGSVFIGFGNDHNVSLLKILSENKRSFYQYIRDFESTASVYGELLHPYLYPCIENFTILVENGKIYDWTKNKWTDQFDENILIGQTEKIYHIKKTKGSDITLDMYGIDMTIGGDKTHIENVTELPHLFSEETGDIVETDLMPYIFRHKTLEVMYRASRSDNLTVYQRKELRSEIDVIYVDMRDYMATNNKSDDAFMRQLCDDLYISHMSLKTFNGHMLTLSRFTTQGRQQTNISTPRRQDMYDFDCPPAPRPRRLMRRNTGQFHPISSEDEELEDETDTIESYVMTQNTTSCYSSPMVLDTIGQIQTQLIN